MLASAAESKSPSVFEARQGGGIGLFFSGWQLCMVERSLHPSTEAMPTPFKAFDWKILSSKCLARSWHCFHFTQRMSSASVLDNALKTFEDVEFFFVFKALSTTEVSRVTYFSDIVSCLQAASLKAGTCVSSVRCTRSRPPCR